MGHNQLRSRAGVRLLRHWSAEALVFHASRSWRCVYTNSVIALDIESGEMQWHFQVVPEDNWDMDSPYESTLLDMVINGEVRQVLIHTSKIGWASCWTRETGQFIHSFRTATTTSLWVGPKKGARIFNPDQIPTLADVDSDKTFEVCPHYHGARNLNSPSYSPGFWLVLPGHQQQLHGRPVRHGGAGWQIRWHEVSSQTGCPATTT